LGCIYYLSIFAPSQQKKFFYEQKSKKQAGVMLQTMEASSLGGFFLTEESYQNRGNECYMLNPYYEESAHNGSKQYKNRE
jgi:hypothetical protein